MSDHGPTATRGTDLEVIQGGAAMTLFGSSDPEAIVSRVTHLSAVLMRAVTDRDLARRYGDSDRAFLLAEAWQLLGSFLGVSAVVVWTRPLDDGTGWEARAEAVTLDGRVIGAADGMCQRTETRGRRSEHAVRAMSQVRARRGALRSVLAFVPAIGGVDLSDPDSPATRPQVTALHSIATKQGWDGAERHRRAGVESLNHLTREAAAELIDEWSVLEDAGEDQGQDQGDRETLLAEAIERFGTKSAVLRAAAYHPAIGPGEGGLSLQDLTAHSLRVLLGDGEGAAHESANSAPEDSPATADRKSSSA